MTRSLRASLFVALSLALTTAACAPPEEAAPADDAPEPDEGVAVESDGLYLDLPRPDGVSMDFVPTPNGWRHRSCVIRLRAGESMVDGHIEDADGHRRDVAPCTYGAYDHHGRRMPDGTPPPTVNGWLASLSTTPGALNYLTANWTVPQRPSTRTGQTLYLFPGLEPLATADTILQPVLAWNGFSDGAWTISSWNCCREGNVFHSTPIKVSPGHALTGSVTGSSCKSTGVCSTWKVVTRDNSLGKSSSFPTTAYGERLDWAFGGAFEAYGLDVCRQLPAASSLRFSSIKLHDTHGHSLAPVWSPFRASGIAPDCRAHFGTPSLSDTTSAVSLYWKTSL